MEIAAEKIGKKFNKEWIFKNFSISIKENQSLAVTGPNGSGKSTLLQLLAGMLPPTEGKIRFQTDQLNLPVEEWYQTIAYAAPYLELIEEMSIRELSNFHQNFKPFKNNLSTEEFINKIGLGHASEKEIRFLSSGMKQRVKLGLALFSNTSILMLDEPTTNLDSKATDWYLEEIHKQLGKRIILICSNQSHEYSFCKDLIKIK